MKPPNSENTSYKETRWHLLIIGKNGSIRPFIHFRGFVMILAGLILVMTGMAGWLLVTWMDAKGKLVALQETVSLQNRTIESIRHEKEGTLARLAIAESKLKAAVSGNPAGEKKEPLKLKEGKGTQIETATGPAKTHDSSPAEIPAETIEAPGASPAIGDVDMDSATEKVTADNLFICAILDDTMLKIEFKVINMGARSQPVSGHAFIMLKDANEEQDQWLVIPRAMLMDGRPVQSRGQRFRIYNYRTIKFETTHENPGVFTQATIFIFKDNGELIFERDFVLEPINACP